MTSVTYGKRNETKCKKSWRQHKPFIQRMLDFFLMSNSMQCSISKASIISAIATDHSAIYRYIISRAIPLASPMLENEEYVTAVKESIPKYLNVVTKMILLPFGNM